MAPTLQLRVAFSHGVYAGADMGAAEELPSPARLHEALVAAAAGGPWAQPDERVLQACPAHRRALAWLEDHEPLGVAPPDLRLNRRDARRFRRRASPVTLADTPFEPSCALAGPVVFHWPAAPDDVVAGLADIAREVTHVGRADSVARVSVTQGEPPPGLLRRAPGRGPGRVLRVPAPGRLHELERAHRAASRPGRHGVGSLGKQAPDEAVTGANEHATALRRFAALDADWPYAEIWRLPIRANDRILRELLEPANRVAAAVGVHRAIVAAIGDDVPPAVTGRDGDGPMRGAGHVAVHLADDGRGDGPTVLVAVPAGISDADRATLLAAVRAPLRAGLRERGRATRWFSAGPARVVSAVPFWADDDARLQETEVPLVLDAPGHPRHGPWSLEDAVTCSVGYAMRGVLERGGLTWGGGWAFRRELVRHLREDHGVHVRARRVTGDSSRYAHRVPDGALVVAAHALVDLGALAPLPGGFLALGRTRHLGGGLLRPVFGGGRS